MSTSIRTAARGSLMLTVAHAGLMLSGYVIAVILARGLGPAAYGVYGIVYSVLLGVELIGRLGVPQALAKLIAERTEPSPRLEGTGMTLTAILYLGIFALFWLFAPQLAELFRVEEGAGLFRIAALDIPFYGMYFLCAHILNGRRRFGAEAALLGFYALARVAGIATLLYIGISVSAALVVNVVASVIALAFAARLVGLESFRPTLAFRGELIRLSIPIGLFAIGSQLLLSLDLWSLNAFGADVPDAVKGFYVAATNVARIPNAMAFVLTAVLVPSIARAVATKDDDAIRRLVRGSARFLAISLVPGCVLVAIEAESVLGLLFSADYRAGGSLLAILVFSHGLLYTVLVTECAILVACGLARVAAFVTLLLIPLSLALEVLLIRAAGAQGAALAALLVIAMGAVTAGSLVHRRVASVIAPRTLFRALIAAAAIAAVAAAVPAEGGLLVIELAGLLAAYAALAVALDLLGMRDLRPFLGKGGDEAVARSMAQSEQGPL